MKSDFLNVAQICPVTQVLGPGKRFVLWVQGCPFTCRGCVSPDWIDIRPANLVKIEDIAAYIINLAAVEGLEGITISGGEPMLQAAALADLLDCLRTTLPDFSAISFSGYTLKQLQRKATADNGINGFLTRLDVLIDGLYIEDQNDAKGMRGSRNQKIHFLTDCYKHLEEKFNNSSRNIEIHLLNDELLMVGVPSPKALLDFRQTADKLSDLSD